MARLRKASAAPLIYLAPDEPSAAQVEADLRFFLKDAPSPADSTDAPQRVLRLPADEILPYDDLSPEAATAQRRLKTLRHLQSGEGFDVLVLSARSLARKLMPRHAVASTSLNLKVNDEFPPDLLAEKLAEAGYDNMPLVEDPGTFAVRGGIVDVFSPMHPEPARLEFFGDTIESIRFFEPESQRTLRPAEVLDIPPAREFLLSQENRQLGSAAIRAAADSVSKPSTEVRELIDELNEGVLPFGLEALLPGFYPEGFEPLSAWLPDDALYVVDDPEQLIQELEELDGKLQQGFEAALRRGDLAMPPESHFLDASSTLTWLAAQRRIELQTLELSEWDGLESDGQNPEDWEAIAPIAPDHQPSEASEDWIKGSKDSAASLGSSSSGPLTPENPTPDTLTPETSSSGSPSSGSSSSGSPTPGSSRSGSPGPGSSSPESPTSASLDSGSSNSGSSSPGSPSSGSPSSDSSNSRSPDSEASGERRRRVHPAWKKVSEEAARQREERHQKISQGLGRARVVARFRLRGTEAVRREILEYKGQSSALNPLMERLEAWREQGMTSLIAVPSAGQAEKLRRLLSDRNARVRVHGGKEQGAGMPDRVSALFDPQVLAHLITGEVSGGFVDPESGFALLSDEDIFGPRSRIRQGKRRREETFSRIFRDLKEGDLVVHVEHGIARYLGLTRLRTGSHDSDFLILQFAGTDKLYLPVHRLRQIQKYVGGDPEKIRLDSLKSKAFSSRKARVKSELLRMAAELLNIYAARKAHPGHAFAPAGELYSQVEADFEYDETPDQAKAIQETLEDMQNPAPMDRLVCGDVGYGKTEVAIRAAAKAVEDGKQVAILVPTTVLAAQHLASFSQRFADYPVNVQMVSRFRDRGQLRETLRQTAEGQVDILIGTHRLLSSDVSFRNLGLVVVDEEQRFGVKHKEALKQYRKTVDVLTLTATPIPRTLHMSLMGVRDLSIIATPPANRRPIRTFVMRFDEQVVKEAIEREMARGGQVFVLHNRVQSIEGLARHVRQLVPKARVAVAHGQMAEGELEKVMTEFVEKRHDVLVCTTIIESGLDIPSANTILVNRADNFGLSQLYQIRGRVGRSADRAFCYLFIPSNTPITRDARKRLQVLQQYTELGAGFHVASHDLEIRGAGNLLGPDQSGPIAAVGFDLYTELMEEAVRELKGEPPRNDIEPEVNLRLPAFIPEEYIPDVGQRLHFYRRLAQAAHRDELYDLRSELADRFGELPEEVDNLCHLMTLKSEMRQLNLRALESGPSGLVLTLGSDSRLDPMRIAQLVAAPRSGLRLTPEMKLVYPLAGNDAHTILEGGYRLLKELGSLVSKEEEELDSPGFGPKELL